MNGNTNRYDHFYCNRACQGYRYFALQADGACFCGNAYSTQPQYVKSLKVNVEEEEVWERDGETQYSKHVDLKVYVLVI